MERRFMITPELRVDASDSAPEIEGYAAVFGQWSELLFGFFREMILPGAFDDVLGDDVRGLKNHDPNFILGRNRAGTLDLATDSQGLHFRVRPPARSSWVRDLLESMERGDINQSSFAFDAAKDKWYVQNDEGETEERREVEKAKRLYDISIVTYPAYPTAMAHVRSIADLNQHLRDGSLCVDDGVLERLEARFGSVDRDEDGSQVRLAMMRRELEIAEMF